MDMEIYIIHDTCVNTFYYRRTEDQYMFGVIIMSRQRINTCLV